MCRVSSRKVSSCQYEETLDEHYRLLLDSKVAPIYFQKYVAIVVGMGWEGLQLR